MLERGLGISLVGDWEKLGRPMERERGKLEKSRKTNGEREVS